MSKFVKYGLFRSNPASNDIDRAVLPTIIFARQKDGMVSATALCIGWWSWGIGIVRTVIHERGDDE